MDFGIWPVIRCWKDIWNNANSQFGIAFPAIWTKREAHCANNVMLGCRRCGKKWWSKNAKKNNQCGKKVLQIYWFITCRLTVGDSIFGRSWGIPDGFLHQREFSNVRIQNGLRHQGKVSEVMMMVLSRMCVYVGKTRYPRKSANYYV